MRFRAGSRYFSYSDLAQAASAEQREDQEDTSDQNMPRKQSSKANDESILGKEDTSGKDMPRKQSSKAHDESSLQGLKLFLKHYEEIIEGRTKDTDIVGDEYQKIKEQASENNTSLLSTEGSKDINRWKNRYKDIIPYDYTRVVLPKDESGEGSDYINANKIQDANTNMSYIASQGPLPSTVDDFWRMIWHNEVRLIIMACKETEMGKSKCQRYWPLNGEGIHFKNITVSLYTDGPLAHNIQMRQLEVSNGGKGRLVTQLHYLDWPDHDAPETSESILQLIEIAREIHSEVGSPILVHCSAGCGRTGAIIAIDYARKLIQDKVNNICVYDIVTWLRMQRPAMVQTKIQYDFIYGVIREMVKSELSKYAAAPEGTPIYTNIDPSTDAMEVLQESKEHVNGDYTTSEENNFKKSTSNLKEEQDSMQGNKKKSSDRSHGRHSKEKGSRKKQSDWVVVSVPKTKESGASYGADIAQEIIATPARDSSKDFPMTANHHSFVGLGQQQRQWPK